jgi:hypothetical protein
MSNGLKDTRISCQFCKIKTWMKDYVAFMQDHDRPDGRKCQRAADAYSPAKSSPSTESVKALNNP